MKFHNLLLLFWGGNFIKRLKIAPQFNLGHHVKFGNTGSGHATVPRANSNGAGTACPVDVPMSPLPVHAPLLHALPWLHRRPMAPNLCNRRTVQRLMWLPLPLPVQPRRKEWKSLTYMGIILSKISYQRFVKPQATVISTHFISG